MKYLRRALRLAIPSMLSVAWTVSALADDSEQVESVCAAAEQLRLKAVDLRHEWTTISPLLEAANDALARGETAAALALCAEAGLQAEQAIAQARREAGSWREGYPAVLH